MEYEMFNIFKKTVVSLYQHVRRGSRYAIIAQAKLQDATGNGVHEGSVLEIYTDASNTVWARETGEFHDGRFISLGETNIPNKETLELRQFSHYYTKTGQLVKIVDHITIRQDEHMLSGMIGDNDIIYAVNGTPIGKDGYNSFDIQTNYKHLTLISKYEPEV